MNTYIATRAPWTVLLAGMVTLVLLSAARSADAATVNKQPATPKVQVAPAAPVKKSPPAQPSPAAKPLQMAPQKATPLAPKVSAPMAQRVVLADDSVFGKRSVIRDQRIRREFLRLDCTAPYTYDQVLAQMKPGGRFHGWRVATRADMEALATSMHIVNGSTDPAVIARAEQLRDWFGNVSVSSTHKYSRGMIDEAFSPRQNRTFSFGRGTVAPQKAQCSVSGYGWRHYPVERTHLVRDIATSQTPRTPQTPQTPRVPYRRAPR